MAKCSAKARAKKAEPKAPMAKCPAKARAKKAEPKAKAKSTAKAVPPPGKTQSQRKGESKRKSSSKVYNHQARKECKGKGSGQREKRYF